MSDEGRKIIKHINLLISKTDTACKTVRML